MDRCGQALQEKQNHRSRIDKVRSRFSRSRKQSKAKARSKMQFEEAVKINDLGSIIDAQYGQWGHFHKEAADLIWQAASSETQPYFRITLAAMLAVTMMNESTFRLDVKPNTNDTEKPENIHCPAAWDFGPCQINFFWHVLETWEGNVVMKGLPWRKVFGSPPFEPEKPFTGDPLFNTRACARIMFARIAEADPAGVSESLQETQVVHYTGGTQDRMDHRRADWRKYGKLFADFFEAYR